MEILSALENSAFAEWLRSSPSIWAYPTVLTLHTVGLAVLVGANWALDLRVLGLAKAVPLAALSRSFPVMWVGFWVNTVSGVMLFAVDATTKGTTTLFVSKLAIIGVGIALILLLKRSVYGKGADAAAAGAGAKALAAASLLVWVAAIAAGRFMAYI